VVRTDRKSLDESVAQVLEHLAANGYIETAAAAVEAQ
jgi:hypothetical protein